MNGTHVGRQRQVALQQLVDIYEFVTERREARLALVVGDPGQGKTRLVQEFYEKHLIQRQSDPPYWPPSFFPNESATRPDPLIRRKVVAPQDPFHWSPQALPSWLWWGLNCGYQPSGDWLGAVAQSEGQLRRHLVPALLRWLQLASVAAKVKRAIRRVLLQGAPDALASDSLGMVLQTLARDNLLSQLPLASLIYNLAKQSGAAVLERRRFRRELAGDVVLDSAEWTHLRQAEELGEQLRVLARPGLPIVVVLEDAHLADRSLSRLLEVVLRPDRADDAPVLFIATASDEGLADRNSQFRESLEWLENDYHRVARVAVEPLSDSELDSMRIPELRTATDNSHAAYRTPLAVELLNGLWRDSDASERESLTRIQEVANSSSLIEDLYLARWRLLGDGQRRSLLVAAASTPRGLEAGTGESFWAWLVNELARQVEKDVSGPLEELPEAWILRDSSDLVSFREPALTRVVFRALESSPIVSPIRRSLTLTRDYLVASAETAEDRRLRIFAAELTVGITKTYSLPIDVSVATCASNIASEMMNHYRYESAIDMSRLSLRWNATLGSTRRDADWELAARRTLGLSMVFSGAAADAAREFSRSLTLARRTNRSTPTQMLIRLDLAWSYLQADDYPKAEEVLVVVASQNTSGEAELADHALMAKNLLGIMYGRRGELAHACRMLEEVVRDLEQLPLDPRLALVYRGNLATLRGRAGDAASAVTELDEVLQAYQDLGSSLTHPDTFPPQLNRCVWLDASGDTTQARAYLEELLERETQVLDPASPEVLVGRLLQLSFRGRESRHPPRGQLGTLLSDMVRRLGKAHRLTLHARFQLARWLAVEGRHRSAARHLRRIAHDAEVSLGASNGLVTAARVLRIESLFRSRRILQGIDELEGLSVTSAPSSELSFVLGVDLATTVNRMTGQVLRWCVSILSDAISASGPLDLPRMRSAHELCALGLDIPEPPGFALGPTAIELRAALRQWYPDEASAPTGVAAQLVASGIHRRNQAERQESQQLGADVHERVRQLTSAAATARDVGDSVRAVDNYRSIHDILGEALGPDDYRTMVARSNLASAIADDGSLREAVALFRSTAEAQRTLCGEFHRETLVTQLNLARTLGDAGRLKLAIALLDELGAPMFWAYGWGREFLVWAANVSDFHCQEGRPDRAFRHLARLMRATRDAGSPNAARQRLEEIASRVARDLCAIVANIAARVSEAQNRLLGNAATNDPRTWLDIAELSEQLGQIALAAEHVRRASQASDGNEPEDGETRSRIVAGLLRTGAGDVSELVNGSSTQTGVGQEHSANLHQLRLRLATGQIDEALSTFAAFDLSLHGAESHAFEVWNAGVDWLLERCKMPTVDDVATSVVAEQHGDLLAAALRSAYDGARHLRSADVALAVGVEWRCVESLARLGEEEACVGLLEDLFRFELDELAVTDPRLLEAARFLSALRLANDPRAVSLDPLRSALVRRINADVSPRISWNALRELEVALRVAIDLVLPDVDTALEMGDGDALQERGTQAASMIAEWMSLVGLDLDLQRALGENEGRVFASVVGALSYMWNQDLEAQATTLISGIRERVSVWRPEAIGLLESMSDLSQLVTAND